MSTYSTIQGTVTLDAAAAAVLRASPSWQWCTPEEDAADHTAAVEVDGDGTLRVDFAGGAYRNLARHLFVDLVDAQRRGAVDGTLTDDCTDGGNERTVVRFAGRSVLVGSGECFHRPVVARPGRVVELIAPVGISPGLRALLPVPVGSTVIEVELSGAEPVEQCGCGGWDDEADEPTCVNDRAS